MIELVIKIPKTVYNNIKLLGCIATSDTQSVANAIFDGVPLSMGHGRLIDGDYLKNVLLLHNFHVNNKNIVPYSHRKGYRLRQIEVDETIINAPTIIPADTIETEEGWSGYTVDVEDIKDLPSVQPQPKTGHWVFDEILDKHYYCSECKSMGVDYWDYCPNCGAKMEVEK